MDQDNLIMQLRISKKSILRLIKDHRIRAPLLHFRFKMLVIIP
jgi:hypothetical protein